MRISDWSSDVCSSDLPRRAAQPPQALLPLLQCRGPRQRAHGAAAGPGLLRAGVAAYRVVRAARRLPRLPARPHARHDGAGRSEEHTSELQSLMRISYAVFCLKKKKTYIRQHTLYTNQTITHTR